MKVLSCMMFAFLLSAGASLTQGQLNRIVEKIRNEYRIDGQFCLAAVFPPGLDPNTDVFKNDRFQAVSPVIGESSSDNNLRGVYASQRLIVARPTLPVNGRSGEHAERRVLQALRNQLKSQNIQGSDLLIYSFASACDTCTSDNHPSSITGDLRHIVQTYPNTVFVFKKVFQPRNSPPLPENTLRDSLRSLGRAIGGLGKIFRCDPKCYSCAVQNEVSQYCIDNNAQPQ
ncbi:uncharacterized protein LOC115773072 [Archocentrus centrarchus]|uniref:uncharacterized protein LOC115773072 n=1 Tax=Archocentrus centrarchus TaxID=63155 RepID=UPI0011E9BBF9|nr:uncharacterized protein LOC115773072 [Archocentrus centrarchus]